MKHNMGNITDSIRTDSIRADEGNRKHARGGTMIQQFGRMARVKRSLVLALTLFLLGGSLLTVPRSASADNGEGPVEASALLTAQYYWQPSSQFGLGPTLYRFRSDGVGLRTTYPTGSLSFGQSFAFAWSRRGNQVVMQYTSGYTDTFRVTGYDASRDILHQVGSRQGSAPLYGCRSGVMPPVIASVVCR